MNYVIAFIILIFSVLCHAQVSRISPAEGLSQSYVNTLLFDKKGYLWLSTEGGLNRYDGYQVLEVMGPNKALDKMQIDRIYQDPSGKIWVASGRAGLFSYHPEVDIYRQYIQAPSSEQDYIQNSVFQMLEKSPNELWLGRTKNVSVLNKETGIITEVISIPGMNDRSLVRSLLQFEDILYIATTERLFAYHIPSARLKPIKHINNPEHPFQHNTKSLLLLDDSTLLVGAVLGLYQLDISELQKNFDATPAYKTILEEFNIWHMLKQQSYLLLGTDKGLMRLDPKTGVIEPDKRLTQSRFSISDSSIIHLNEDNNGGVWAATRTDGAFYLPPDNHIFDNVQNDSVIGEFSHGAVWGIVEFQGYLWAATRDGLTRYDPNTREAKPLLQGYMGESFLPEYSIFELFPFKNKLWLISNRGLFVFDPKTEKISRPRAQNPESSKILSGFVKGAALVEPGLLYFVDGNSGFYLFNMNNGILEPLGESFAQFDPFLSYGFFPPLSSHPTQPVFYSEGRLFRYDHLNQKLLQIYQVPKAHKQSAVDLLSYTIDKNNVLWLSFATHGLVRLTADGYKPLPLPTDSLSVTNFILYEMQQDKEGMIWMSSHQGIWRLDPDNFHLQGFTINDGLMSNEFNSGSSAKLKNGHIAYGSLQGITIFDPEVNRPNRPLLTRVNITNVDLMSRELKPAGLKTFSSIELNHDDIGLEVSFSAMAFTAQERIVYEYQLSGEQRILSRNSNRVVFPKLNPGNYRLKVWAKDPLTGDYTEPAELHIRVKYPIWRSPLALACYLILASALFALWVHRKNRVAQLLMEAHKDTRNSETRLKMALEGSNSGVWDWQSGSNLVYQPRLLNELGYKNEYINLDDYLELIHPQDRALFRIEWLEFVSTAKGYIDCTYRLRNRVGQWRWYKDYGKVMAWREAVPMRVAGTYTNLTRERVFEERAALFGEAFEQTRDWVMIFDKRFRILACNKALQDAFDVEANPTSSTSVSLGLERHVRLHYLRAMSKLVEGEHHSAEEVLRLPSGEVRHVLVKVTATLGQNYIIVLTDISKQKRTEKELYQLANYDALTKLPNKVLFMDRVQHGIEQSEESQQSLAILAIKFGRLQRLADTFGDDFVLAVIRQAAKTLQCCFREMDSLAIGQERDFYILMEHLDDVDAVTRYAQCLVARFEEGMRVHEQDVQIDVHVGISLYPDDASDAFELNQAAEIALSHAKKNPQSYYQYYHQDINQQVKRNIEVERRLSAILNDDQLCNYYQPILNATQGSIEGFEVMLRWPDDPNISAEEFASAAEKTGLGNDVILQTIERALIELKVWHLSWPDLYISVNISAQFLHSSGFVEGIRTVLEKTHLPERCLVFEISESVMMKNVSQSIERMLALKALGCRVFMDDFGTGYTSLMYLTQFPVSTIKIDEGFITDIGNNKDHESIIHSTLSLAHSLGKDCIAQGVENIDQLKFLRMLGCERFQGYLFSPALPGDMITHLMVSSWQEMFEN
ncbi:EAL domain-containing protein [Pseudoalteromonas umbrosa]|uniref:EAL domain-containing protein n=1 Tax=Pseudoalteromonas umbrosa TaxID=3048489 RepID=UPI0024C33D5A|nr:EAL domain-containing protein [Pseudoalteromonas sp. B95]MDK1287145.1 EAL domain-containing protein [Pseudoalteromonas sp. B95]